MDLPVILTLVFLHILLTVALYFISQSFKLNGYLINKVFKNINKLIIFLLCLCAFTFFLFMILIDIDSNYVQILNFIISFVLIFEVCMNISNSERFINWIGHGLEKSLRILIMFVISLNCTYFFTRITHQVINSQG